MAISGIAKPLASLSSGLLARKGQARPAMRPQGFADLASAGMASAAPLEDLGWNDMGWDSAVAHAPGPVVHLTPMTAPADVPVERPQVLAEREILREQIAAPAPEPSVVKKPVKPVSIATANRIGRESAAQTAKGKAAFTLRLDGDRHLRLRLASAVANQSAQALVVEALDRFLADMPTVEQLAVQLPRPTPIRSRRR